MKIIIETLDAMNLQVQIDAVQEYIRYNSRSVDGTPEIKPTPTNTAHRVKLIDSDYKVHVMCIKNKGSYKFKTWRAI